MFKLGPELTLQIGRLRRGATPAFNKPGGVAAHLFQKLHVAGLGFDGHIRSLKQLHNPDAFLFLVDGREYQHVLGGQLCFTALSQRASFAGLQHIHQQAFVKRHGTGTLPQPGLLKIDLCRQPQTPAIIQQPDPAGSGPDGRDHARQKLLKELLRRQFLPGELLDLTRQLHHTLADLAQIFVRRNWFAHGFFRYAFEPLSGNSSSQGHSGRTIADPAGAATRGCQVVHMTTA